MAFQLKSDKKETENKTVRFPIDLIEQINAAIVGEDVTFSSFVIQACEYALNSMEENNNIHLKNKNFNLKENKKSK